MKNIFKKYKSTNQQEDIFGEHSNYIKTLHTKAFNQYIRLVTLALKMLFKRLTFSALKFSPGNLKDLYISIDPLQGRFLYNLIIASKPKIILVMVCCLVSIQVNIVLYRKHLKA